MFLRLILPLRVPLNAALNRIVSHITGMYKRSEPCSSPEDAAAQRRRTAVGINPPLTVGAAVAAVDRALIAGGRLPRPVGVGQNSPTDSGKVAETVLDQVLRLTGRADLI